MFIALARERHFGRAAEACHVTQPSLSSAIRALEDFYGVSLVQRGSRFMGLTPEGERLLLRARGIVAEARAIRQDLRDMREEMSGTLRLGVIPTALSAVHEVSAPFMRGHPRLRLEVRAMSSHGIAEAFADFEIDAAISYSFDDAGRGPGAGFELRPLYRESWAVVFATERAPDAVVWEDLAPLRLCLLGREMQNRRILDKALTSRGISLLPAVESSSIMTLVSHVMAGAAEATVLPLHPARFWAAMPGLSLRVLPQEDPVSGPEVALILPAEGRRGLLLNAFARSIAAIGKSDDPTRSSI